MPSKPALKYRPPNSNTAVPNLTARQTDSTRAHDLELHIQSRVTAELKRLEAEHTRQLKELSDRLSQDPSAPSDPDSTDPSSQARSLDQSNFATGSGGFQSAFSRDSKDSSDLGRQTVQKEIEVLKRKLEKRKPKEEVVGDEGVERAKGKLVKCLRERDRRPLDCWEEVEGFKREVGRLEKRFVEAVLD